MKKEHSVFKRLISLLICTVMVLALVPVYTLPTEAAGEGVNYVSLPITIRDYAADGMLFQYNERGATGDYSRDLPYWSVNPSSWSGNDYLGIRVTTSGYTGWATTSTYWHCIVCKSDGTIVDVIPSGTGKGTSTNGTYITAMASGSYAIWIWIADSYNADATKKETQLNQLAVLQSITDSNKSRFKITYDTNESKITITDSKYHEGNTLGYGLLATSGASHFNDLTDTNNSIPSSNLIPNDGWNSSTPPTAKSTTLNSGASQEVHGAYIRTDLVEKELGKNGAPVYTEDTVTYLANYMKKTLPEPFQNSDGSYNMWYVFGDKLSELSNTDLATKLRTQINGNDGTYLEAKTKYDAGNLTDYTDVASYYDAAYFLLHNIFSDNTGYGQTVNVYNELRLVQKTVDGKTYYVYNSAYDNSVYDTTNGAIYNSQTETITARKTTSNGQVVDQYVRGNIQPETRFDPLNSLGYGKSGDQYTNLVGTQENYYNNTNYNLTLEGHAQFIYYYDEELYFTFTGDDDVYLYINGTRVLDLGGAHAISKASISLNNVAELCGLKDGEAYTFDFYYMERHGTAANFGIETNIKIVDPSMLTKKNAYQNGANVGNYGFVDANKEVMYEFVLTNNGDSAIENLTFKDEDIEVNLTPDAITLNSYTEYADLAMKVEDANGSIVKQDTDVTADDLKAYLVAGLAVGQKITIRGFNYDITKESKWNNSNQFPNTVYTTAVSYGDNNSTEYLNGVASCTVQKVKYTYDTLHYYEWLTKGVTAEKSDFINIINKIVGNGTVSENDELVLCSPSGDINNVVVMNGTASVVDDGITFKGNTTGQGSYYVMVGNYGPIAVAVYIYNVTDNAYVLDYGLPVELNDDEFGFTANDVLELPSAQNPYTTTATVTNTSVSQDNKYGIFEWKDPSLVYTLNKFMSGTDKITITIQVLEAGATEVTPKTGVEMTQLVTTVPANVMYYEDTFADITYIGEDGNYWMLFETEGSSGNKQSADQDSNYGSDPNYAEDKFLSQSGGYKYSLKDTPDSLSAAAKAFYDSLTSSFKGDSSNGTVHALYVENTKDILTFTFTGTGFEIVSRTTTNDYAVLSVKVTDKNGDIVKQFPVITECENGDLYQVPIISVDGLELDEYTVTLQAAKSTASKNRVVYIDGIRIYGPLGKEDALEYYNPEEVDAEFLEIKGEIAAGTVGYAWTIPGDEETDEASYFISGTTMVEDYTEGSDLILQSIDNVNAYLTVGPNNELYLDGGFAASVIAFYAAPTEETTTAERTIEIGAHRKSVGDSSDSVTLVYGDTADSILSCSNAYTISSGTEQYYTIDTSKLTPDEEGRYLIIIGIKENLITAEDDNSSDTAALALTNLKISGYTLSAAEDVIIEIPSEDENLTGESPMLYELSRLVSSTGTGSDDSDTATSEGLEVLSAKVIDKKVRAGDTITIKVEATSGAESVVIRDAEGREVEIEDIETETDEDGTVVLLAEITIPGEYDKAGMIIGAYDKYSYISTFINNVLKNTKYETISYTVYAVDAEGAVSENEVPVSVSVKKGGI